MIRTRYIFTILSLITATAWAQRPQEILLDEDPFDFTDPIRLIFIVILPLLLIIIGALVIRYRKQKKASDTDS